MVGGPFLLLTGPSRPQNSPKASNLFGATLCISHRSTSPNGYLAFLFRGWRWVECVCCSHISNSTALSWHISGGFYVSTPTFKGIGGKVRSNQVREKAEQGSRFSRPEIAWCDKAHVHTMLYRYRENSRLNIEETLKIPHHSGGV